MAETYQFTWAEVQHIQDAIGIARDLPDQLNYAHIEADEFDLYVDKIGIRITIPPERALNEERKTL